jgi:hypothetical protein
MNQWSFEDEGTASAGEMRGAVPFEFVCFSTGRGHCLPLTLQPAYASNGPPDKIAM